MSPEELACARARLARIQAIAALLIGAFTFGNYLTYRDAQRDGDQVQLAARVIATKVYRSDQAKYIDKLERRVLRVEIILENMGP